MTIWSDKPCNSVVETAWPIRVETINPVNDNVLQIRTIDYNNKVNRVWLSKHALWAFHNGYAILSGPAPKDQ